MPEDNTVFAYCPKCELPIKCGELCQELNFGAMDENAWGKNAGIFHVKDTTYYHQGCI